jgi:hypothetical protein
MDPFEIATIVAAVCVVFVGLLYLSMHLLPRKNLQDPVYQHDNGEV